VPKPHIVFLALILLPSPFATRSLLQLSFAAARAVILQAFGGGTRPIRFLNALWYVNFCHYISKLT
jgi:hypothetical protein